MSVNLIFQNSFKKNNKQLGVFKNSSSTKEQQQQKRRKCLTDYDSFSDDFYTAAALEKQSNTN